MEGRSYTHGCVGLKEYCDMIQNTMWQFGTDYCFKNFEKRLLRRMEFYQYSHMVEKVASSDRIFPLWSELLMESMIRSHRLNLTGIAFMNSK